MASNVIKHDTPVRYLPGIGEKKAELFKKLGLDTVQDLLYFYPRDYEDWSSRDRIEEAKEGEWLTIEGMVAAAPTVQQKGRLAIIRAKIEQDGSVIQAVWFNQPWLRNQIKAGESYLFHGQIDRRGRFFSLQNPNFVPVVQADFSFRALYPLTKGLTQYDLRRALGHSLNLLKNRHLDPLPDNLRREYKLCTLDYALENIHRPRSKHDISIARARLGFDELFLLQLGLRLIKARHQSKIISPQIKSDETVKQKLDAWVKSLPYQLTSAQKQSIADITGDFQQGKSMNRLLQGDVGSGKTVIAAYAMALVCWSGYQSVFMAPTAILAAQHYESLLQIYQGTGLRLALLTGSSTKKEKDLILNRLVNGEIDLLLGTHAVLEDTVKYKNLGICIVDEQHRFGVDQRARLGNFSGNDLNPHILVMSATPIPRTLALIIYGDLDISLLTEKPPGRLPVATYTAREKDRTRVEEIARKKIAKGEQIYIVCPMIEENSEQDLESAVNVFNRLSQQVFPHNNVALLHGRLKAKVKADIMNDFSAGDTDILVTTTVIEVGVDNPNATMMIIENAERFGLAQLHQLRGRIGRGKKESLCILMSESNDDKARERLAALCRSNDGFELAEEDLRLRGPGDFFGIKQHGLPEFKLVNLYEDRDLIIKTSQAAEAILQADPDFSRLENRKLLPFIEERLKYSFEAVL